MNVIILRSCGWTNHGIEHHDVGIRCRTPLQSKTSRNLRKHLLVLRGKCIGQYHRLRRGSSSLDILMKIGKMGTILHEVILFTHHAWVLYFALVLVTLNSGLLGFFTTFLRRHFLVFILVLLFTP